MASKKTKTKKQTKTVESPDKKRVRTLQIVFMAFSVILILSMMLSLAAK